MAQSVILLIGFVFHFLQTPEPGARHQLLLRLRHLDGRPATGVRVKLLKMPDRTPVGWQNTDSACQTNDRGECAWQLFGGLYEFSFPPGLEPDPITLTELGEGGLHNLSVFLDRDFSMGIVLADPRAEPAGGTLFFDRTLDEPVPQIYVPSPQEARPFHRVLTPASRLLAGNLAATTPSAAAGEPAYMEVEPAPGSGRSAPLLRYVGLIGLVVMAFILFGRISAIRNDASPRRPAGKRADEEGGPWP